MKTATVDITENSKDNPFGSYNADIYSMENRLKKKRDHL